MAKVGQISSEKSSLGRWQIVRNSKLHPGLCCKSALEFPSNSHTLPRTFENKASVIVSYLLKCLAASSAEMTTCATARDSPAGAL